jgi:carbon storage regulator
MLVLSRRKGERLHVGEDVIVHIKRIAGGRVTISIEAPRAMRILRGELIEATREFPATASLVTVPADDQLLGNVGNEGNGVLDGAAPGEPSRAVRPPVNPPARVAIC